MKPLDFKMLKTSSPQTTRPPCLLSKGYREFIQWALTDRVMGLTTHLHLVLSLRISGAVPPQKITLTKSVYVCPTYLKIKLAVYTAATT